MLVLEVICFVSPSMMEMVGDSRKEKKLKQLKKRWQEIRIKMKCDREDSREREKSGEGKMQIGTDSKELFGIINELCGKQCGTHWAEATELQDYTLRTQHHRILSQLPKQL